MGKAIPYDKRKQIIDLKLSGQTHQSIAIELGYSISSVKSLWSSYKKIGIQAFQNNYKNCGQTKCYSKEIQDLCNELRDNQQGGAYIRSRLEQKYPDLSIPNERTIQRWWKSQGTNRSKGRPTKSEKKVGAKHRMRPGK